MRFCWHAPLLLPVSNIRLGSLPMSGNGNLYLGQQNPIVFIVRYAVHEQCATVGVKGMGIGG